MTTLYICCNGDLILGFSLGNVEVNFCLSSFLWIISKLHTYMCVRISFSKLIICNIYQFLIHIFKCFFRKHEFDQISNKYTQRPIKDLFESSQLLEKEYIVSKCIYNMYVCTQSLLIKINKQLFFYSLHQIELKVLKL